MRSWECTCCGLISLYKIAFSSEFRFELHSWNGVVKLESVNATHPSAHISTLKSYGCCLITSGERYRGVPCILPRKSFDPSTNQLSPKSPSLTQPFLVINIFRDFISRWIIFRECRYSTALDICHKITQIYASAKYFFFNHWLFIRVYRSPLSAYYIIIYSDWFSKKLP